MNLTAKLVTSLVIGAVAATATALLQHGALPGPLLLGAFCAATLATAALTGLSGNAASQGSGASDDGHGSDNGDREQGQVKWFNVSKGFGFIIKDDGEEIFVHFRSIRGEGRRSLRDGQRVEFNVAESEKGPQAEDVVALD